MPKWRNRITIKHMFTSTPDDSHVLTIVQRLTPQLERILESERNRTHNTIESYWLDEFGILIDDFKWVQRAIETDEDAAEYEWNSWTDAFNDYLTALYDMADTLTGYGDGTFSGQEKFLWVG